MGAYEHNKTNISHTSSNSEQNELSKIVLCIFTEAHHSHTRLYFINLSPFVVCGRYNRTTGVFTVPDSSAGLYFFSMHFVTNNKKYAYMWMQRNSDLLCGAYEDTKDENGSASCSVTAELNAGKENNCFVNAV